MAILLKLHDQMSGPMGDAADRAKQDLDALAEKAKQVGERFASFGRNASVFGLALGAGVQQTVSAFAKLDEASARLKSTLMTDKGVSKNFEAINTLAIELGNRLPGTTADFAAMLSKLLQLGVSEEAILGGVGQAAANLAVVMKLPYEQAAEIAAKLKEATGTAEADMLRFMDTIQRVGHQGVQSGEMMLAFARSAGALKQFDVQGVEQAQKIAAVYAQLLKAGASGETVGTGMSMVLQRLLDFDNQSSKGAEAAADSLKELGIQIDFFDDKTGQFRGVDNMIAQFDKLKVLNQSQMGDVLKNMFGGGQDSQFVALLAQGGVQANRAMQQSMVNQADIAARVGVQLETLSAKWEAATGTFENLLAKIGESMGPQLGVIVDWFNEISASAQKLVEDNKELFGWLGLGVAGTAAALVVGGGMALAIGSTLKMIGELILALKGLSVFLAANPMVLTIMGVAAAGAAGYAFGNYIGLDEVGAKLGRALFDVVQSLKKGWSTVKTTLADWRQLGVDIIEGLWEGIKATMRKPLDAIGDLAKKLPQWAKDLLGIKSPSRVFMVIGQDVAQGLVVGMEDSEDAVRVAAEGMVNAAIYAGDAATMAMIREQEDAILDLGLAYQVAGAMATKAFRDSKGRFLPADEAERAAATWERAAQDIEKSLTDSLFRAFEGGKGFGRNLRDTLVNTFKTMVLQPTIKAIVAPVAGALAGVLPQASLASQAASAASGGGGLLNLGSAVSSVVSPGAISYAVGEGVAALASTLGASTGVATGIGAFAASAIPIIGIVGALASLFGKSKKPQYKLTTTSGDISTLEDGVGAASPFGNIGLSNSGSKNIKASEFQEYLDGVAELDAAIAASLQPDKIKAIAAALDGFTSSKNADSAEYLQARLAIIAGEVDATLGQIVESWQGTSAALAETVPALVALHEYAGRDTMTVATEQLAVSSRTLMQQWQNQGASMRTLLASYDGGIEATRELATLTQSRYAIELQLAQQIHTALASTQAMFASTIEEMRYSVLDQAGKYDFLRQKSAELEDALKSAVDPTTIDSLATKLNETAKNAWQLLGEEERKVKLAEYETYLNEIDTLTTERLNAAGATITADKNAELPASISAAIEAAMSRVADQMMAAAQAQMAAAQTPQQVNVDVNVNVDTPSSVEVGVLGGG